MSNVTVLRDLLDRWVRVWHEGQYDLVPGCVAPQYIRHDEIGDRVVTPETYAAEIAATRKAMPGLRFVIHDRTFQGDRIWIRSTLKWTDKDSGELRTLAAMQVYRVEGGEADWLGVERTRGLRGGLSAAQGRAFAPGYR
jgi:SnoaL-like domain